MSEKNFHQILEEEMNYMGKDNKHTVSGDINNSRDITVEIFNQNSDKILYVTLRGRTMNNDEIRIIENGTNIVCRTNIPGDVKKLMINAGDKLKYDKKYFIILSRQGNENVMQGNFVYLSPNK